MGHIMEVALSRFGRLPYAECPACHAVSCYWDEDDLDENGNLLCYCDEEENDDE